MKVDRFAISAITCVVFVTGVFLLYPKADLARELTKPITKHITLWN